MNNPQEKSLGQVAYESFSSVIKWCQLSDQVKDDWNRAATAVQTDPRCASGLPKAPIDVPVENEKYPTFEDDLKSLINRYSIENESGTPDFILAEFLRGQLDVFSSIMLKRDEWHGNSSKDMIISKPCLDPSK